MSGLNACHYCHGVHAATARTFGIPEKLVSDLLADVDTAAVRLVQGLGIDAGEEYFTTAAGRLSGDADYLGLRTAITPAKRASA